MNKDEQDDQTIYKVVVNHEEQYSIWPADRENARGWKDAGKTGTKQEVTAYVKERGGKVDYVEEGGKKERP